LPLKTRRGLLMLAALALCVGGLIWWRGHGGKRHPAHRAHAAQKSAAVAGVAAKPAAGAPGSATPAAGSTVPPIPEVKLPEIFPRVPASLLEAQVALARRGISCGSIDGVAGAQTVGALEAFQDAEGLEVTGRLDRDTKQKLLLFSAPLRQVTSTADDLARLQPLGTTWLAKSQQSALDFATLLEMAAERSRANPALIRKLNPAVDWDHPTAGLVLTVPAPEPAERPGRAASVHITLEGHVLQVRDADNALIAHFPVSIAKNVEKRPVGELHVTVVIRNPNYTFDPDVFPESPEAQELGRKLILQPGPNNPVGLAWVGLDRPGYGIHGTPNPEQVGRTESHGCFRLANWDAVTFCELAWVGMPVFVDP
jgi:lipoprotein-anchoring transpeptidase ErfK/SrfK